MRTSERVVLVTGASSGIGAACARHLGERGFRVFGTSRSDAAPAQAASGVEMLAMDVDRDASVEARWRRCWRGPGGSTRW